MRKILAVCAILILAVLLPAHARAADDPQIVVINAVPDTKADDKGEGGPVKVFFSVQNAGANATADQKGQIALFGSKEVEATVGKPDTPIRIVFVIDVSGSMQNQIAGVREAAKKAVDAAPENAQFLVFTFSRLALDTDFRPLGSPNPEKDRGIVKSIIDTIKVKGPDEPTCLFFAGFKAVDYLRKVVPEPQDRRAIILFTDGKEDNGDGQPCGNNFNQTNIIKKATEGGITTPVYTLGLCAAGSCGNLDEGVLKDIAKETKAQEFQGNQNEIEGKFGQIMDALKNQFMATGKVFMNKGKESTGTLKVKVGGTDKSAAFAFTPDRDYLPTNPPTLTVDTPFYDRDKDLYRLNMAITNYLAVKDVNLQIAECTGNNGARTPLRNIPVTIDTATAKDGDVTFPVEVKAQTGQVNDSMRAGATYCFRINANNKNGQPLTFPSGNNQTVTVFEQPLNPYQPDLPALSLITHGYNAERDSFSFDVTVTRVSQVATLAYKVIESQDGTGGTVLRTVTIDLGAATGADVTKTIEVLAKSSKSQETMKAGSSYAIFVSATDKNGRTVAAKDATGTNGSDALTKTLGKYDTKIGFRIENAEYSPDVKQVIIVISQVSVKRADKWRGAIKNKDGATLVPFNDRSLNDKSQLVLDNLPKDIQDPATQQTVTVEVVAVQDNQSVNDTPQIFSFVVKPQPKADYTWPIILGVLVLAIVAGALYFIISRARRSNAYAARPQPFAQATGYMQLPPAQSNIKNLPKGDPPKAATGSQIAPPQYSNTPPLDNYRAGALPPPNETISVRPTTNPNGAPVYNPTAPRPVAQDYAYDQKTETYQAAPPRLHWEVIVEEGDTATRVALNPAKPVQLIGRNAVNHNPDIRLSNSQVSREHARLSLNGDDLRLTALTTSNGTFLGVNKQLVAPNTTVQLRSGDVFWLSPHVRLRVEQVNG